MVKATAKTEKVYLRSNASVIICDMVEYIQGCDISEWFGYFKEIGEMCECPLAEDFDKPSDELWKNLVESVVFRDAFGKMIEYDDESVLVNEAVLVY